GTEVGGHDGVGQLAAGQHRVRRGALADAQVGAGQQVREDADDLLARLDHEGGRGGGGVDGRVIVVTRDVGQVPARGGRLGDGVGAGRHAGGEALIVADGAGEGAAEGEL